MKKSFALSALYFFSLSMAIWNDRSVDVSIVGPILMADGIGRQSVELFNALKNEYKVELILSRKPNFTDVPLDVIKSVRRRTPPVGKVVIFEDVLYLPAYKKNTAIESYKLLGGKRSSDQLRIAYSMLESTRIPDEWAKILNEYFDAVAVPDPFLVRAFLDSGVQIPIFVLPLGLDLSPFFSSPIKAQKDSHFIFANLSTCLERKNHLTLVRAFAKKFKNNPKVSLVINSRYGDVEITKALKKEIKLLELDNVHFSLLGLNNAAYLSFFRQIDCYVSLSKGEGFSIQPREALALGIPTIVTNNTGQSTISNSNYVVSVSSPMPEPAKYFWGDTCGHQFYCDVNQAAEALQEVYDHYDEHLKRAQLGREWVKQYQFSSLQGLYKSLVHPKKIILGDQNILTEEYVMTSSKELYEKYQKLIMKQ